MSETTTYRQALVAPGTRSLGLKIGHITPQQFKTALLSAMNGQPAGLYQILERFRKLDGHLSGDLQRRISAVALEPPNFVPLKPSPTAEKAVNTLKDILKHLRYPLLSQTLLTANYFGVRAVELVWDDIKIDGKTLFAPVDYRILPHDFIYARKTDPRETYTSLFVGNQPWDDYPQGKITLLTHEPFTAYRDIDFIHQGVGLAASRFSVFKYYDYVDWAAFNEVYGIPTRIGYYDDTVTGEKLQAFENAVHNMGSDASAVLPEGTRIEFPEVNKASSVEAFEKFKEACDREISAAILSQSITSSSGKHGTYGTALTANGISLEIAASDAYRLDMVMQDIVDVFLHYNFTSAGKIVFFTPVKKADNLNNLALVSKTLQDMGLDLSIAHLRRQFNAPAPEDPDDTLPGKTAGTGLGL